VQRATAGDRATTGVAPTVQDYAPTEYCRDRRRCGGGCDFAPPAAGNHKELPLRARADIEKDTFGLRDIKVLHRDCNEWILSRLGHAIRCLPALAIFIGSLLPDAQPVNWSGYEAHVRVQSIQATWTLPVTQAADNFPTWIGIGGVGRCSTLIQAGTTYNPNFHHYTVWWELVQPGDLGPVNIQGFILQPASSVTFGISYRAGRSTFTLRDNRTGRGKRFTEPTPRACKNPADFVVERLNRPVRFGAVTFAQCMVNGRPLDVYHPIRIVMNGTRVSRLDKSGFTVSE
jgi:hypothetical protein